MIRAPGDPLKATPGGILYRMQQRSSLFLYLKIVGVC